MYSGSTECFAEDGVGYPVNQSGGSDGTPDTSPSSEKKDEAVTNEGLASGDTKADVRMSSHNMIFVPILVHEANELAVALDKRPR